DEFRMYNGILSDAALATSFANGPNALLGGRPKLAYSRSGNTFQLVWPADADGYALEQSAELRVGTLWSPVTNTPVWQHGNQTVTLAITSTNTFFRLRK